MVVLKAVVFTLILTSVCAYPEPDPDPYPEEEAYDDYEYKEEPVDYEEIPEFKYPTSLQLQGVEGGKVTIPCQFVKESPYVLIVKKEDEDKLLFVGTTNIVRSRRFKENNGNVEISGLKARDAGTYVCRIQSDPPIEVQHHLDVQYSPKIIQHSPSEQQVPKEESVKLECEASGNPTPVITWSKEGGRLSSGAHQEEGLSMTLEMVDRHVEGTYVCTAENGIGSPASANMTITVTYPPEIVTEKTTIRTGEGDKVELVCIVHARPSPKVMWTKDGQQVQGEGHVEEFDKGHRHSLQISDVTENDFGTYQCEAMNDLGSSSADIHLTGYPKPPHVTSDPNGGEETSYTLTWETESYYPILEYHLKFRKVKANDSTDLPGEWEEGTYDVTELETESLMHKMKHTLDGLQPATDYHATLQVKNKFDWSESVEYAFSTKKELAVHQMTGGASLSTTSTLLMVLLLPTLLLLRT